MRLSTPLTWNEGVFLMPVTDLPDDLRDRLAVDEGSFALTRPQGRSGSKVVDAETAVLVERFREPHSVVEAVILCCQRLGTEPRDVLEEAFPMIRELVRTGYLVPVAEGGEAPTAATELRSRWQPGDRLPAGRVERVLQVLSDTELYLVRRSEGSGGSSTVSRVVKVARPDGSLPAAVAGAALRHEAAILDALGGRPAPARFAVGEIDGRPYLEMEAIAGVDLDLEAGALRGDEGERRDERLLRLATSVAEAYAQVHASGVVHGDVHPRNLLVERDGSVRIIDFGLARATGGPPELVEGGPTGRGGVPFFYEPELARAYLLGETPPVATPAGEQYAVGALVYYLVTGLHPRDYSLGREEMLREIVELPPLEFRDRGLEPWPELENVLRRALAKEPERRYSSLRSFAEALAAVGAGRPAGGTWTATEGDRGASELLDSCLEAADLGSEWMAVPSLPAPSASINYGAAGVALALLGIAQARDDARLLSLADLWLERARGHLGDDEGFYNPEIQIDRDTVGEASPYHSETGIHLTAALLGRARGHRVDQARAAAAFLDASARPAEGLDLTLGRAAGLLGATILLDALDPVLEDQEAAVRAFGDDQLRFIWRNLDLQPAIPEADIDYLGIAHGWAGLLYSSLAWCEVAGVGEPAGAADRLSQLAELATPEGRGATWPWTLRGPGGRSTMAGWCNGSCGYVFLWTLAHRRSGDPRHLELARGAAWNAFDAPDQALSLCCGLAGRAYALLNLYRHTDDAAWLERARSLARRAAARGVSQIEAPHSLYKGELGLAVLTADLERPREARMPLFEALGYRGGPC